MAIQGIVSAFGPDTIAKWDSNTPLDGELMQKSLDMLLENDNLMASAIGERTYVVCDEYNRPNGEEVDVLSTRWNVNSAYGYATLDIKVEGSTEYNEVGYSIPSSRKSNGEWFSNGNLTSEMIGGSPRLYWATTENRWSRIVNIAEKPTKSIGPSGSSFELTKFTIPCETGILDCSVNTPGTVQLAGSIELEILDSNTEKGLSSNDLLGLYVEYGNYKKPFTPIYSVYNNELRASITQILNFNVSIPASSLSGTDQSLRLSFGLGRGNGARIGCKASSLMVTYSLGTV